MDLISREEARAAGAKRFFTGAPCPYGHTAERFVINNRCVECAKASGRATFAKDPDRIRQLQRESYLRHREKQLLEAKRYRESEKGREKIKAWAARNADRFPGYVAKYRENHRDELLQRGREAYKKNREKHLAYAKVYREKKRASGEKTVRARKFEPDREMRNLIFRRFRAKKMGAAGDHTVYDVARLLESQKHLCVYCKTNVKYGYHVDHITPLARGGSNGPENIQILCPRCNVRKRDKTHDEFIDFLRNVGF